MNYSILLLGSPVMSTQSHERDLATPRKSQRWPNHSGPVVVDDIPQRPPTFHPRVGV
jgi:hypothetical protein